MSRRKIIFLSLLFVILIILILNSSLIYYGIRQAYGQLRIVFNTVPVTEVLNDPEFPDSLKHKIKLIQEVRDYAVDSLGLEGRKNYTTFYDQGGEELMWVVSACEPFELEAYTWDFPILGSFSYKGYFDSHLAVIEESRLKKLGYDTDIRNASGWSTLGILKDPVLSGMLTRSEASLTELIIHELSHGTIFVIDSIELNENLATFIGNHGAIKFLEYKYGENAGILERYKEYLDDRVKFTEYVLKGAGQLEMLYSSFDESWPYETKEKIKNQWIDRFILNLDTVSFTRNNYYETYFDRFRPDNTFFMSYLRYRGGQEVFERELNTEFNGDLKKYVSKLKEEYGK